MAADTGLGIDIAYGTLGASDVAPTAYTDITGVMDFAAGETAIAVPKIKTTDHAETNGAHTYIPGPLTDTSDFELAAKYDKTQHNTLRGIVGVRKGFKYTKKDGTTGTFIGWVSGIKPTDPQEDVQMDEIKVVVGGKITWTPAV